MILWKYIMMRGVILKILLQLKLDTIKQSFKEMKPIVDEKIIWFTYYNNEPIAFILAVPDINVILKPLKGKFNLLNKIRFLWLKKTTTIHRIRFIVMGCKKKFQNKGIESGMIRKLQIGSDTEEYNNRSRTCVGRRFQ